MDFRDKLRDSYDAGKAQNRRETLAAVAQAFAAGDLNEAALALLGFTVEDCRSAMAAATQQASS